MSIRKQIHYRYKLTEHAPNDRVSVSGYALERQKWSKGTLNPAKELVERIRSNKNPKGWIVMEKYIPDSGVVMYNSDQAMNRIVPIYTNADLLVMNRNQVAETCEYYAISTVNRTKEYLISLIIQEQNLRKIESEKGEDRTISDELKPGQVAIEAKRERARRNRKKESDSDSEGADTNSDTVVDNSEDTNVEESDNEVENPEEKEEV